MADKVMDNYTVPPRGDSEDSAKENLTAGQPELDTTSKRPRTADVSPRPKRKRQSTTTTRSRKRVLVDEEPVVTEYATTDTRTTNIEPSTSFGSEWFSQQSQKSRGRGSRGKVLYGSSSRTFSQEVQKLDILENTLTATPRKPEKAFTMFDMHSPIPVQPLPPTEFASLPDSPIDNRRRSAARLQLPEVNSFQDLESPQAAQDIDVCTAFDRSLNRSPAVESSSSSLSDLDSVVELELSQKQQEEIANGSPVARLPAGKVRCPLCESPVNIRTLSTLQHLDRATLQQQQRFCIQHRLEEAESARIERGYPDIDWVHLERERIPRSGSHLRKVLYRKTSSFYVDHMEAKVKSFRNNKKGLNKYLREDILKTVKPGYYGPRGARIMGHWIAQTLSKQLRALSKTDNVIKSLGVGDYISFVLSPELCQLLVMEDLNIDDQQEARKIIDQSTDIGVLIHADDEYVERLEDE